MGILALITMVIWVLQINELIRPAEKQDNRKTILLTTFGCLFTTILTINLFQNFIS